MPIRDKVYNKLKSLGLTDSKEDFFNYYDNDENVRKDVYRRLREDGLRNSEDEFYSAMKPQKVTQQPEDNAAFEANAERFRNGQPIERVTTQSVIDANPELGLQQPAVDMTQQYIMDNKPAIFGEKKKSLMDVPLNVSPDAIEGSENLEKLSERARIAEHNMKDPFVQKARTEADVRGLVSEIDGLLEKSVQEGRASVGGSAFMPAGARGRAYTEANKERVKEVTDLSSAKRLLDQSQYIIDAAKRGDTGILKDTWQGFKDSLEAEDFTFGLADAASSASILDAIKKVENGEELTEAEDKLLRASAINMATQYYYANDLNRAYKAGQVSAESVPFMLEMAINPISSLGKASAKTLLNYGLKSFAKHVGKGLAKGAAAGTGMALTTGLGRVAAGTTDRLAEGYNYGVDFDGNLYAEKKEDAMGVGEAVARSLASTAIENQSEMIFNAFKGFGGFMKGVQDVLPGGVNKFFDMLSHNKVADAYRYIKNSPVFRNYLVKDIRNATQIGGLGEEYLEEVYNNLANAAIGEMKWEDVVSLDKNIDTLLGLAPTQVMFGLLGLGGAGAMRYQTRKTLEDLQATMNEQQRKDLEGLLDMGLDAKEVDVRGFIRNVMQNESYTIENKRDLIKAAYNVAKQNGIDELTEADTIDKVNAENSLIDSVTDPSTGIYTEITATLPDAKEGTIEVPGYVVGWMGEGEKRQPIFVQEGMENTYENRRVLKPGQWSEEAVQQMPVEEVKAINEEMIREEAAKQAEQEAKYAPEVLNAQMQQGVPFDTPNAQIIPVAPMPEGNGWIVEEYALDTNNKVAKTPIVRELTNDEYRDMLQAQLNAEEAAQEQLEEQAASPEVVEEVQPNQPTEEVRPIVEGVANQPQAKQQKQPTLEEVVASLPKTNKGEIDYKAMTPQQQYQYTSITESPEVALEDLQADITAGQEEIVKKQEKLTKAKGGERAALRDEVRKLTQAQAELQAFYDSVAPKQDIVEETAQPFEEVIAEPTAQSEEVVEPQPEISEEQVEVQPSEEVSTPEVATEQANVTPEQTEAEEQKEEEETAEPVQTEPLQMKEGESALQFAERAAEENDRRTPLRKRAEEWAESGVEVVLHESIDSIENQDALDAINDGKIVPGWFDGKAHVFLPHVKDLKDLDKTVIHEAVAHKGLRGLLTKEQFNSLCDKVWWDLMSDADRIKYMNYPGVSQLKNKKKTRAAADEYMAHLAEDRELTSVERSTWEKIVQFIKDLLGVKTDNKGKAASIIKKDSLSHKDLADLILLSYKEFQQNKGTNFNEENVEEVDARDQERRFRVSDLEDQTIETPEGNIRFSVRTAKTWIDNIGNEHKGTIDMVVERMSEMGFTKDEIDTMNKKMQTAYDYMVKLSELTSEDGSVKFEEFNEWAKTTPMYKQVGRDFVKSITSLVSNGDYPINLELTTDCIKREAYTHLLNTLVRRGADLSNMRPGEIVTIQKLMKQYGIEVACELCFVEGKRLQIINWASQIVEDWNNALTESGINTDEYFEFGKDGDAFIPSEEWKTHEDKAAVARVQKTLDDVELLFSGIDPKKWKSQKAKNKRAVEKYKAEAAEKWAKKSKKDMSEWKPNKDQKREIRKLETQGLAPTYVNENTTAFKKAFDAMRLEWMEKNPKKDPLSFEPTKKQWTELNSIRNQQIETVKQKMVRLMMEYPEMRKKMTLNDLLGSKGLMEIRQQHGEAYEQLYSIILQRFGTGTPKPVQDAVPYDGEVMTLSNSAYANANKIGGARLFSFSDFDITKVFDYMQMFFDLEANKQKLQSYTKEVGAVIIFGRSNAKFNISTLANAVVPESVKEEYKKSGDARKKELRHEWAENAGLSVDKNGNITGINFSAEHSVSPDFAKQIFHDDSRNKDCGAIMVGASVNHAIYSAAQDWIRMVIPFHLSGMPIAAREKTDVLWYTDNTEYQSTRKKSKDGWGKISSSEDTFSFYDTMGQEGWNMRDKAREYLSWCEKNGYRPKFDWGINSDYYRAYCEENGYTPSQQLIDMMDADTSNGVWNQYYKFLTDFTAYKPVFNESGEMVDEIPSPQQPVVTDFDFSELEKEVLFEGENSLLSHREENIKLTQSYINEIADLTEKYLSGELSEEDLDLKENVFYDNSSDANRYLDAIGLGEGTHFRFIGEHGAANLDKAEEATTRLDNLNVAREMEAAEKDAKTIKMATGWERGADGLWRYETKDIELNGLAWVNKKKPLKWSDVIVDDELFVAYPELADVRIKKGRGFSGGSYSHKGKELEINLGRIRKNIEWFGIDGVKKEAVDDIKDTIIHELQHAIQDIEGFAPGGSSSTIADKSILNKIDELNAEIGELFAEWDRMPAVEKKFSNPVARQIDNRVGYLKSEVLRLYKEGAIGSEGYKRLAGEVEARNAASRMDMSEEERRNTLAVETEDVARKDQIFLKDALGVSEMGSRVRKRMAAIAEYFDGAELTDNQKAIVNVFGGLQNNLPIVIHRTDGETHRVIMRQGREDRGGSKHSILRHFDTGVGSYTADEVLIIEDVLTYGEREVGERRGVVFNEYQYTIDGIKYTVLTEKKDNREEFANFFTNRSDDTRSLNTQLSARAGHTTASADKDTANSSDVQEGKTSFRVKSFETANEELDKDGISINNKELMDEYGLSDITLSKSGNHVTLSKVVVEDKGQGNGTRFMEDLTNNADNNGWILALTPDTSFGGSSVARLKKFYKRFGFKDNKGRNTDFETRESMVRPVGGTRFRVTPEYKQHQMDIINETNPASDDVHTWIRSVDDIKSFEEALDDSDYADYKGNDFDPSYTWNMVEDALETGKVTVYSSYPIKNGVFVTPSYMEAQSYGGTTPYMAKVNLEDVAWIDPTQGQLATDNKVLSRKAPSGIRFRISDYGKKVKAEVDKVSSKYNSKDVMFFDNEMTDEEVSAVVPGYTAADIKPYFDEGILGGYSSGMDKISIFANNNPVSDIEDTLFHENLHSLLKGRQSIVETFAKNALERFPKNVKKLQDSNYEEKDIPEELLVRLTAKAMVYGIFDDVAYNLPDGEFENLKELLKEFGYEYEQEIKSRALAEGRRGTPTLLEGEEIHETRRNGQDASGRQGEVGKGRKRKEQIGKLFDQVADMGLQGVLGNKEYTSLMVDIYKALPEEVRAEIAEDALRNYGGSVAPAVSDYIGPKSKNSIMDKVVTIVREALRKVGFDLDLNANEVRYMAWRSKKPLDRNNMFEVAEDIDMKYRLKVGEYDGTTPDGGGTRFRVTNKLQVRDEYEATIKKGGYQAREAVQDAMLSLRKFQELIEKASGKKIRDFENAWMHENRLSSVVQAEIHDMERKFYKPMMDAVKKLMSAANLEQEQVADYLMLKHGIERNREMAVRKALTDDKGKIDRTRLEQWYQDKRNVRNRAATPHLDTWRKQQEELDNIALLYGADMSRDYSGLTSMFDTDDLADSTQKAYDEVEALENAHPVETKSLGKAIKAMTQNTLDKSFESGLMDRKVYDELSKDMYDYYIPLRGFEETTSEEVYAYLDQDRGAFNAPLKRAKGRSSKSDNPIAYLKSIAESGIMQGERNKMKQSFLNMVINNPSDLVSVREGVWVIYNPATGEWEAASAPAIPNNATPADVEAAMEAWEQQMEQAAQNDPNIKKVSEAADVPYRVVGNKMDQHQIIVKRLGKSYTLTINGNPRLAMAINGQTNPNNTSNDGKVAAFVNNKIGALNRSLAAWYTTRNPDFVASNFMRDTFYTNTIVRAKEGNAYANKFHKNYATVLPKMLGLFRKYENGTLNPADQTEDAFLDFMMNGGETGYSNLKDVEEIKKQISKELKGNRFAKVEALAEKLDILNRAVENTARFAAFLTSREEGRSIAKSVFDAKEISVNFNKKGAGGTFFGMTGQTWFGNLAAMIGASGRALYVFFNAAIQGSTNLMHVMKINPKGTSAGLAAMFLMGAVIPFLFDDDDEKDYYDLPEHVRRNHLIIPGTGDAWISIPLPIEYRIMYGMGELLTSWRTGHERGSDIGRKMLNLTGQALPLNFLEEGFDAFIPSALSPVWQVYNNRSWTGLPIYKDNEFNKDDPEYTKAYKNVDRGIYEFTKALYNWTFDEENQKERIDLNPAVIESLARGYFGGLATQLSNIGKTAEIVAGEREFDWRSIPIGNRLFKSGDERTKEKRVTNEYFENMEKLDFLQSRERMLKKTENGIEVPEADKFKAQKDLETMQGTEVYKKYQEFKKQKKVVDKIRKTIKEKGSTPEREKQLIEAQEAANKSVR